jgi:ABC-type nitrate/sulfonate/bicarbonate transport system substrate-binding protein
MPKENGMMKQLVCLVAALMLLAACAVQPPEAGSLPEKSGGTEPSRTISVAVRGSPNVKDLPFLMALDVLRDQGYTVDVITLAKGELIAQAIEQGDVNIANVSPSILWVAVAQGADIRTVAGNYDNTFYLVTETNVETCHDLDGLSLAFSSKLAAGYVLFEEYIAANCPGVTPQIVIIGQSENRVVALQSGEIDGAYLEMEQWLVLSDQSPGDYHIILNYGQEYPHYLVSGFAAQKSWADGNPEILTDFVRSLLTSQRRSLSDTEALVSRVAELLELDAEGAARVAEAYLEQGVWDPNGGLDLDRIEYTLGILRASGAVPEEMTPDDVADLAAMNAVLDELGRE